MIGEPRWPSSTLTLTHIFYMIGEPRQPSSTLALTHVFYMIGEPWRPSSILTQTHIFDIRLRGSEWPLGAHEQPAWAVQLPKQTQTKTLFSSPQPTNTYSSPHN